MKLNAPMIGVGLGAVAMAALVATLSRPDTGEMTVAPAPSTVPVVKPAVSPSVASADVVDDAPMTAEQKAAAPATWSDSLEGRTPPPPPREAKRPPRHNDDGSVFVDHRTLKAPSPTYKRPGEDGGPLLVAKVGAELLFERHEEEVARCLQWDAPSKRPGEHVVLVDLTIVPTEDGAGATVGGVRMKNDTARRYRQFEACLALAFAGEPFMPLAGDEPAQISWHIYR